MPDNTIVVNGVTVRSSDRGAGVQSELTLDGNALTATVLVAAVGTTSATPAFAADTTTSRVRSIRNTGSATVEVSPVANFALGAGMPLKTDESMTTNYSGAIYARVGTGAGELRMWSEH